MENINVYSYIKVAISGLTVFSLIHFLYIYIKIKQKKILITLIISALGVLYILCDTLIDFFTINIQLKGLIRILIFLKEIIPLVFLFMAPFYLKNLYFFKGIIKKINTTAYLTGFIIFLILTYFHSNILFFSHDTSTITSITKSTQYIIPELLLVIKTILITIYLLYSIILIVISEIESRSNFPVKNILIGLVVLSYIAFYYIYIIIFTNREVEILYNSFPYISLGIAIFIVFLSFAVIDKAAISNIKLGDIQNSANMALYYDPDLEVPNRLCFKNDLSDLLNETLTHDREISLFFLDVDDFKNINESYGEKTGNVLLKMLTQRMVETFGNTGVVYRIGGDEFAFIIKGTATEESAEDFASKIISSLRNPFILLDGSYMLTVSIAILLVPRDGNTTDEVISNAYSTIHSAKKQKNSYSFFNKTLQDDTNKNINTVNLLRNCISNDEFVLFYQPILNTSGKIVYAEALLRCTNDNPEIGGPGKFIPLLEKAGLMKDIDNLVISKAFHDMEMKINNRFGISINMSPDQLVDPSYGDFLSSFAKQHSIEPRKVILEITESTVMENIEKARESLAELKNKGFLIAIDDFGKGFSSLTYLAELPADILKIDMAFVHSVPGDKKKEMLVQFIIELGKSLNLVILAEGFERHDQVDFFKQHGCSLFQGYYFSHPVPLSELFEKYTF